MFIEIFCLILLAVIILQQCWHSRERDVLIKALAAKDWSEFHKGTSTTKPPKGRSTVNFSKFPEAEGGD